MIDAPALPHEIYPATTLDDRICGPCYDASTDWHSYWDHVIERRGGEMRLRCDHRNGSGQRTCTCRDFACIEHPDNTCGLVE